jgi:hypothetical protein
MDRPSQTAASAIRIEAAAAAYFAIDSGPVVSLSLVSLRHELLKH